MILALGVFSCRADQPEAAATRGAEASTRYPKILLDAGIQGTVSLRFAIDSTGAPVLPSIAIVKSSHNGFIQAARAAVLGARFPGMERESGPEPTLLEALVVCRGGSCFVQATRRTSANDSAIVR